MIAGFDLGGTRLKTVLMSDSGQILASANVANQSGDYLGWANATADQLKIWETEFGALARIGISAPGLVPSNSRTVQWMKGRLEGLEGFDWGQYLGREVTLINDAQSALLAEAWIGAASGEQDVMMLTLGTGVGGAAMVDGHVLRGHLGRAGHLGHISVSQHGAPDIVNTPGSLEDAMGECTLEIRSEGRFKTTADLITAVKAGDSVAIRVWEESIWALAVGIASLINVLDPRVVVLGGGISQAGDTLLDPLKRALAQVEWMPYDQPVELRLAQLGDLAGAIGAARATFVSERL